MMASASLLSFAHAMAPSVAAHGNQPCYDANQVSGLQSGISYDPTATNETGVYATVDFHHDDCGDDDSLASAWVGLVPDGSTGEIVQAGIIQCRDTFNYNFGDDPCFQHPGELRYFFAYGGCNLINGPNARDGGPATDGGHAYKVEHVFGSNPGWLMTWPTGSAFIAAGNVSVACFSGIEMHAQYAVEKWDRGDSTGGSSTQTFFANEQHRNGGSNSWIYINATGGNCHFIMQTAPHTSYCTKLGAEMRAWD